MKVRNPALIGAVALALAACAGGPQPTDQMAAARSAVSQAGTMPVGPEGSVELQKARAKLALAEQALRDGVPERAKRYAEQAEVDAKLAMAWSNSEKGKLAAVQANDQLANDIRQPATASATPAPAAQSSAPARGSSN